MRDWGWASEYVEAMWLMLQAEAADDYVIATGTSYSLEQFVEKVFALNGLDGRKYVQIDKSLFRPLDIYMSNANPEKAKIFLGWQANINLDEIIARMHIGFKDV